MNYRFTYPNKFRYMVTCEHCGTLFGSNSRKSKYCKNACRQAAYRERCGKPRVREPLGNRGNETMCSMCGTLMLLPVGSTRVYCSDRCRKRASRLRRAARDALQRSE